MVSAHIKFEISNTVIHSKKYYTFKVLSAIAFWVEHNTTGLTPTRLASSL